MKSVFIKPYNIIRKSTYMKILPTKKILSLTKQDREKNFWHLNDSI